MAMLLVIVAVGVGVVLAGVALTARDTGPRIGRNAESAAQAAWSARAGAAYVEALLRSGEDWAGKGVTELMSGFEIAGGEVSISLTDTSGAPPTADTREFILTATAEVNGMTITESRRISRVAPVLLEDVLDPYLGEFGIFTKTALTIEDGAIVQVSPLSKEYGTLMPVKIGTGFSSSSALAVGSGADVRGAALYVDATGSTTLKGRTGDSKYGQGTPLPLTVPAIPEVLPAGMSSLPLINGLTLSLGTSGSTTTLTPGRHTGFRVQNNATVVMGGTNTTTYDYRIDSLQVLTNGILRIQGTVRVYAPGTFQIANGACVELADAASNVTFYIGNGGLIDNAGVGVPKAVAQNSSRSRKGLASCAMPGQIRILALSTVSGGTSAPQIRLRNNSIVAASIHAPHGIVEFRESSTLIGRVTAGMLEMRTGTVLWYEPAYDSRTGFTELMGPLYCGGAPVAELSAALGSIDADKGALVVSGDLTEALKSSSGLITYTTDTLVSVTGSLLSPLGGKSEEPEVVASDDEPIFTCVQPEARLRSRRIPTRAADMESGG